jgi:hypothetical protein
MTMNVELLQSATYPNVYGASSAVLLRRMTSDAREQALSALAAALVRRDALELADAIEAGALAEARDAAVEPMAAIEAARKALDGEEGSIAARLSAYFKRKAAGAATGEPEPNRATPEVQKLRAELAAAEQAAQPFVQRVQYHEEQVAGLRRTPRPNCVVLEALGVGVTTPCDPKK